MAKGRPAWSGKFATEVLPSIQPILPIDHITPDWAFGGSDGEGIKVAVIDSGIDAAHPAVGGRVAGYVAVSEDAEGPHFATQPHEDDYGHGTACAGIIHALAPACELYSVKVLGTDLLGRGNVFVAGLRWAIEHDMRVCNLSLGTTHKEFCDALHELADQAYFRGVMLVAAANNLYQVLFPSVYAAVFSVAAHDRPDPYLFYYNPQPPVEFGAPGIGVRVAWKGGGWITSTGNSFATPHITGIIARILGKHPELTPFQMKTVLRALAGNMAP